jgi:polyisoprenoid-binding protein YceI
MSNPGRPIRPILAGLMAGVAGAIIASLVSLPLKSPDDLIANTATVTVVALLVGLLAGIAWQRMHETPDGRRKLILFAVGGFVAAVIILGILEAVALDRFISFGVPLAAIIFAAAGLLPPALTSMDMPGWAAPAAVVAALVIGGGLASFGDAESGDLSLDDLPAAAAPETTVTTVTSTTTGTAPTSEAPATSSAPDGPVNIPDDLPTTTFTFTGGTATWSVPETFVEGAVEAIGVGRSETLSGTVDLAGTSEISVDLTTFVSDQSRRDNRVNRLFEADPIATFTTSELALPETYAPGEIYATDVTGELTVNSVTRTVTWSVEARLVDGQLDVTGELDIVLTDFDVEPPSIGGFVVVEDEARLEVLFSATG